MVTHYSSSRGPNALFQPPHVVLYSTLGELLVPEVVGQGQGNGRGQGQGCEIQGGKGDVICLIRERHRLEEDNFSKTMEWLEKPNNFSLLHGSKCKNSRIGGKFLSKKIVFNLKLVHLHATSFSQEVRTGTNLGKRFEHFIGCYKVTLDLKNQTGGGVIIVEA